MTRKIELLTLGGGCFWCTEAVFQQIKGVIKVVSGYSGGTAPGRPTYREVCSGLTGHAEVIQVSFDASIVDYEDLLEIFMTTHDPTTLNRQGADVGTAYRSIIFYHNHDQERIAKRVLDKMQLVYEKPIVTELRSFTIFYEAELQHQNFYNNNKDMGYCTYVINPKLQKLRLLHANKLK